MNSLIFPILAQAGLILCLGLWLVWARMGSVARGKVSIKDVRKKGEWPAGWIRNAADNFNHQFELPILFFVLCFALIHLDVVSDVANFFAWLFVASRIVHSLIQLSVNHIPTRFIIFILGVVCTIALFIVAVSAALSAA